MRHRHPRHRIRAAPRGRADAPRPLCTPLCTGPPPPTRPAPLLRLAGGMLIPTKSPQQRMQEQAIPIPVERDQPGAPRIPPSGGLPPNYPGGPGGLF